MKIKVFISIVYLTFVITGCQNRLRDDNADVHEHDSGDVKVLITGYSDKMELFAEADPFVVGKSSELLVHLTYTSNFKPVKEKKVTVGLIVGSKGIRKTVENPESAGIYRLSLVPDTEGSAILFVNVEGNNFQSGVEVKGLSVYADEHDAIHAAEDETIHSSTAITFTKEQSWKVDFATEHPNYEQFGEIIKAAGQIQSSQGDELIVTAKTNGVVSFTEGDLFEGESIAKGESLLTINSSGMAENSLNVRFTEAKNNFDKAKADYERLVELSKDKISSEKDLLIAKTEYENAKVLYENMNQNFSEKGQRVFSLSSGFVKQVFVKNGQYVDAGDPILSILQNSSLQITLDIQQKYFKSIPFITSANIKTLFDGKIYSLKDLNGKIASYGRTVNPDNFMIPVFIQIQNIDNLIPGNFVEVFLKTSSENQLLTVPNSAILEEQGNFFLMAQITPELFEKREVKIGITDGIRSEIVSGINKNERVVTKGAMLVKLAQSSGALDPHSGHVH